MSQIHTPEDLIARCIERMGGLQALASVVSLHCSSTRTRQHIVAHVELYRAVGGRVRIEESEGDSLSIVQINGLAGLRSSLRNGRESRYQMSQDEITEIKRAVRLYPRNFLAHADEYQYELSGVKQLKNLSCYVLRLPVERATYYYDAEQFDCIRLVDATGQITEFDDYRQVSGLRTPFIERVLKPSGEREENVLSQVRYNLKLDDALFEWS